MKFGRFAAALAIFALTAALAGADTFHADTPYGDVFRNLSKEDVAALDRGEPVVHPLTNSGKLSLALADERAGEIGKRVGALRPNYMTELIASIPVRSAAETESILDRLAATLADVVGYMKIPYWSKRQQTTYDLFDKMEVLDRKPLAKGESIEVRQHMEPFDDFRTRYEYRREAGALRFSGVNLDTIVYTYKHFSAVSPGNMIWELYVFRQGDRLDIYGVGAVKAFDLFGLFRDRLEPSIMGRVEAFFRYVAEKINQ